MKFQIRLAEQIIEIHALYDAVSRMCEAYRLPERQWCTPAFTVVITPEDITREGELAQREARRGGEGEGLMLPPQQLETTAVYRKIAEGAVSFGCFVMHGSVVSTAGQGYMLTAPSGVGKTTRTALWVKHIPDSFVVNGDKPLLRVSPEEVRVYGTPWSGKENWNRDVSVPLRAIFLLERADDGAGDWLRELRFAEAFPRLLHQTYLPADASQKRQVLSLLRAMDGKVKCCRFHSEPTAASVRLAWSAGKSNAQT